MLWTDMTFGVEVECYSPLSGVATAAKLARATGLACTYIPSAHGSQARTCRTWKIVPDGSLNRGNAPAGMHGIELVSPILKGDAGIAQVMAMTGVLQSMGAKVNVNCGLHVHVGAGFATHIQLANLGKSFIKNEHHFDAIVPPSRRHMWFAKSNRACASGVNYLRAEAQVPYDTVAASCAKLDRVRTIQGVATVINGGFVAGTYPDQRYFKLNLQPLQTHGTVEYRQAAGSVDGMKISAWIKCVTQFTAHAFSMSNLSNMEEPTFQNFLRKFDRKTAEFLDERRSRLNPNPNDNAVSA